MGREKIRPRNAGTSDSSIVTVMIAAQVSMTTGFSVTTRTDVSIAELKSISRSSSMGMATTVTVNSAADRIAPAQVPIARKVQPCGVKKTMFKNPLKSEKDESCRMIASQSRTW